MNADLFASSLTPKIVIGTFVHHGAHRWADVDIPPGFMGS